MPGWVLGFHGTTKATVKKILNCGCTHLGPSKNTWDWLGDGIYFWENDPIRAKSFAIERKKWKKQSARHVAVIGAVIDFGNLCA